ncbi:MAG: helix-turn-helix transcriptional regulator [Acholeplasma sp.]|nr:helix-turn-helix transcriptional regulator [Acholeplasma sp.]
MNALKLKELRKRAKMTQYDVAKQVGITQAHYSRWENGLYLPDANQILQLCNIFGCTPNDLFGFHGAHAVAIDPLFEDYKKLVNKIKKGL